jgi:hypothetical protein
MTTSLHLPTLNDYLDGLLTPTAAARSLLLDLGEVESEIRPLEGQRSQLRDALATVLVRCEGRKHTVEGVATARLSEPTVVKRWNGERLGRLCAWLRDTEREEIAEMIEACCELTPRAGGLRVEPERKD